MKVRKPKILLYDVECFPNIVYTWPGSLYEVNVVKVIKDGELASVAYKWLGEKQVHCITREGQSTDKQLLKAWHKLLGQADMSIAHNGNPFDNKVINTRILNHRLTPPPLREYKDTKVEAKKYFRFNGNSLVELARFLGLGDKVKTDGFDMWEACMADDPKAWRKMVRYNKNDVTLLEDVLEEFKPWIKMPISMATGERVCAAVGCNSPRLKSHGMRFGSGRAYRRLQCLECGHWNQETLGTKIIRPIKSL